MLQLFRFVIIGILNTVIGLSCIYGLMYFFNVDYRLANAAGYSVGCTVSFLLNRSWTFRHRQSWIVSFTRWLGVVMICYVVNLLIVIILSSNININAYVAQLGGNVCYTALMFLGAKYFAFRHTKGEA